MTQAYYEISKTSAGTLVNIETAWGVVPPLPKYYPYGQTTLAADGGIITQGLPVATWDWGFISLDAFNDIRTFCAFGSVDVWLRTTLETNGGRVSTNYGYFTGKMIFPELSSFRVEGRHVYPFRLTFTMLVQYTPGD